MTTPSTDHPPPRAADARNEHVNDADLRAVCGSARPCDPVQVAEHNLPPEEPVMKPVVYGYLRVTDDLDDHRIRRMERGLHLLAEAEGFRFATTFHEDQPGYQGAFRELTRELRRADAHHVVVPSLGHLSPHPLLRDLMLTCLEREADAHLWVAAP